jgi:hypothetical protein
MPLAKLLLYRGCLAYIDPLYTFCIFGAIAMLRNCALCNKLFWVAAILGLLTCPFLLSRRIILLDIAAFAFPLLRYSMFLGDSGNGHGGFMLWEVTDKLSN